MKPEASRIRLARAKSCQRQCKLDKAAICSGLSPSIMRSILPFLDNYYDKYMINS
jgi:hypothetical protein